MSKRFSPLLPSILAVIVGGHPGCGPSDETLRIKLTRVDGTVTFNGKPLEGAIVTFSPDESNDYLTPGSDVTGPEGNYKPMFRGRAGLYPGKYKIVVEKLILPPGAVLSHKDDEGMLAEIRRDPKAGSDAKSKDAGSRIRGEFDGEVPNGGGQLDFDVKGKAVPVSEPKS
jgi:hypothetical protein